MKAVLMYLTIIWLMYSCIEKLVPLPDPDNSGINPKGCAEAPEAKQCYEEWYK